MHTAALITVDVEGRARALPSGTTLAELVARLGHEPAAVTTALNGRFVPRQRRDAKELRDGDAVLLFRPIVGG